MTRVAEGIGEHQVTLFVGDQIAASDDRMLREHGIMNVLNCAVNCDVNYVDETLDLNPGGCNRVFGFAPVRVHKVGMIDGFGNDPMLLFSAVHVLHGMLRQTFPDKQSYKLREQGNVLVHCRGGRSRSVAVAGLYMHRIFPQRWPSFEAAIDHIRKEREIPLHEYSEVPTPGVLAMAREVLQLFDSGKALLP